MSDFIKGFKTAFTKEGIGFQLGALVVKIAVSVAILVLGSFALIVIGIASINGNS